MYDGRQSVLQAGAFRASKVSPPAASSKISKRAGQVASYYTILQPSTHYALHLNRRWAHDRPGCCPGSSHTLLLGTPHGRGRSAALASLFPSRPRPFLQCLVTQQTRLLRSHLPCHRVGPLSESEAGDCDTLAPPPCLQPVPHPVADRRRLPCVIVASLGTIGCPSMCDSCVRRASDSRLTGPRRRIGTGTARLSSCMLQSATCDLRAASPPFPLSPLLTTASASGMCSR